MLSLTLQTSACSLNCSQDEEASHPTQTHGLESLCVALMKVIWSQLLSSLPHVCSHQPEVLWKLVSLPKLFVEKHLQLCSWIDIVSIISVISFLPVLRLVLVFFLEERTTYVGHHLISLDWNHFKKAKAWFGVREYNWATSGQQLLFA